MKLLAPTSAQWRKLPRRGETAAQVDSIFVVWHAEPSGRVGMVVNKSFGNAVARNRLRRRLRAAATEVLASERGCWLLIAREGSGDLTSDELVDILRRAKVKINARIG